MDLASQHATVGDVSAAISGAGVVVSFMTSAMPELQFIAVLVSIVAGVYAIRFYSRKIDQHDRESK